MDVDAQIAACQCKLASRPTVPYAVHREHAPPRSATPRGVIRIVVEDDKITGNGLQRHVARKVVRRDPEQRERLWKIDRSFAHKMLGILAAGKHAQAPRVASQGIEIESELDPEQLSPIAVRVPIGITCKEVPISPAVVEIVA